METKGAVMGYSNYPPGVTGNEPQISGVWPLETIIPDINARLKRIADELEAVSCIAEDELDPHGGAGKLGMLIANALEVVMEAEQEAQLPEEPLPEEPDESQRDLHR